MNRSNIQPSHYHSQTKTTVHTVVRALINAINPDRFQSLPDTVLETCVTRQRRIALTSTINYDGRLSIFELVDQVAAQLHDCSRSAVTIDQRQTVRGSLQHCALPKLTVAGILNSAPDESMVAFTAEGPSVNDESSLEKQPQRTESTSMEYSNDISN